MSKIIAGETIRLELENGEAITVKIEDASKSEAVSAKVLQSNVAEYHEGQVYAFARTMLPT